jgi:PKD repeat protein
MSTISKLRAALLVLGLVAVSGCMAPVGPVAVIAVDRSEGFPPFEVKFDASGSQDSESNLVAYNWDFADGTTASGKTVIHTFEQKGDYEVVLTVTDDDGRSGEAAVSIHAQNLIPHADFRITPFGAPRDYPVQFDASSSNDPDGRIVSYQWDFGDGTGAEGMHVEHIFPQQQTEYLVTLTVIDDDGAANHSARTVVVLGCDTCG